MYPNIHLNQGGTSKQLSTLNPKPCDSYLSLSSPQDEGNFGGDPIRTEFLWLHEDYEGLKGMLLIKEDQNPPLRTHPPTSCTVISGSALTMSGPFTAHTGRNQWSLGSCVLVAIQLSMIMFTLYWAQAYTNM